ncbi:hypothetical protein FLONG3_6245 [Fusarium longipes]|uniref:Uncharacterized protein n=1 Tax=Fusarium longipes TaxID=694270 RepID=A0A395SMT7_9HYPO|nr:hypothetical protein FLONG3_6245 [Fusarium longipes]
MASNDPSASCAEPPLSLLVEQPIELTAPKTGEGKKLESAVSSSPGSDSKPIAIGTSQRPGSCLSSFDSVFVSSVDDHTPPTDPPKPVTRRALGPGAKRKVKIIPRQNKTVRRVPCAPIGEQRGERLEELRLPPNDLSRAMRETWARYPPPSNEEFPVYPKLNTTPKSVSKPIEPEGPLGPNRQHSETNFLQPLSIQGAIRNEYAAHLAHEKLDHDEMLEKVTNIRRWSAEKRAAILYDVDKTDEPTKFPVLNPNAQEDIYKEKVDMSALSRKVAICDGTIEGIIAGEFTFHKDTAHLPPTKEQMAILQEAEGLKSLFPKAPAKLSFYDQWLKDQSANPCPASNWLTEAEKFAKKKAFNAAFSEHLENRFPSKSIKDKMPAEVDIPDELVWEKNYFPSMLPTTPMDPERYNMYETRLKVQVPKWFPTFVQFGIVPIDESNNTEKQYKELLTTIWKLESQMLKKTKPSKWDKNWHEKSPNWTKPHHQESGGYTYHQGKEEEYETFNETKPDQELSETDVIFEEFSFDDVFTFGQDVETKPPNNKKSPEMLLKEIAEGVKKAVAKVGM